MRMLTCRAVLFTAILSTALSLTAATTIRVDVDAREARNGIFHTEVTLPDAEGAYTFVYPKWIPGEHQPTGPLMQMMGLKVSSGGRELPWRRDGRDMFAFHVVIPSGARGIVVAFDYVSPSITFGTGGYGESPNATQNMALLPWSHVVVYPAGAASDSVNVTASLRIPDGWQYDTSLPASRRDGSRLEFSSVTLTRLVDSPLFAGRYLRTIPVDGAGKTHLTMVADSAQALALPDEKTAQLRRLVTEADLLFGARHYDSYRWLLALSDTVQIQGLEHHESSDNRGPERMAIDPQLISRYFTVLAHEYVHSWNGKYRRPAGLATPDFQEPMDGELLWVYEGMTRYLGDFVLVTRSGLRTPEETREFTAYIAANLDRNRPGRNWRSLADTAIAVQVIAPAPSESVPSRRSLDYYDESLLVWLDADNVIRKATGGRKSLDEFVRSFFGPPSSGPAVRPYTLDDLIAALNAVAPSDWRSFFQKRVYDIAPHPPLGALEAAGWKLTWSDQPNWYQALRASTGHTTDLSFSLGIWVKSDGLISDVVGDSPAAKAGLTPGMKLVSIDGRKWSGEVAHEQLSAAVKGTEPLKLQVESGTSSIAIEIPYHAGERYPHLERISDRPDVLSEIMKPRE